MFHNLRKEEHVIIVTSISTSCSLWMQVVMSEWKILLIFVSRSKRCVGICKVLLLYKLSSVLDFTHISNTRTYTRMHAHMHKYYNMLETMYSAWRRQTNGTHYTLTVLKHVKLCWIQTHIQICILTDKQNNWIRGEKSGNGTSDTYSKVDYRYCLSCQMFEARSFVINTQTMLPRNTRFACQIR